MKLLFLSLKLYILGHICDHFLKALVGLVEKSLSKNLPLTKKLLINMSNFSNAILFKWHEEEQEFLRLLIKRHYFGI